MRIFCDFHHRDLINSLCHLFEKRMKWELYVPYGMEFFTNGYWHNVDNNQELIARQFLVNTFLNAGKQQVVDNENGTITIHTNDGKLPFKAMDFNTFCNTKFDIILCSVPGNIPCYMKMLEEHQPQAKFVFEAGNNWGFITRDVPNLLTSSTYTFIGGSDVHEHTMNYLFRDHKKQELYKGFNRIYQNKRSGKKCNVVFFHPEFDLEIFKNDNSIKNIKSIYNIRHNCDTISGLQELEKKLSDWEFKAYGVGNKDGELNTDYKIAEAMNKAGFIYHVKPIGDGYGYNIHQTYAVGSVLICNSKHMCSAEDQKDWFTGQLLMDIENYNTKPTFIDWGQHDINGVVDRLKNYADNYPQIQQNVLNKFKEVVDFDEEYKKVKTFIEQLI